MGYQQPELDSTSKIKMKIKKNIQQLKDIIKLIENINEEVDFIFCKEGIIVKVIDPPAISMALFRISSTMFEEYDIEEEQICTFQMSALSKIIKRVGKKELTINLLENKAQFISPTDKFTLKYFVGAKDDRPEPQVEGSCSVDMKSSELFKIIKDFGDFSEVIKIHAEEGKLKFKTRSHLIEGETISSVDTSVDVLCWYPLPCFQMIEGIQKVFEDVTLDFSKESPCQITAKNENIKFKWVLAPRIGDEE